MTRLIGDDLRSQFCLSQSPFGIILSNTMGTGIKSYKPGQVLFTEGEPSLSIFIVQKGGVSIRKAKGQNFVEVAKIAAGEIIGELSFFDRLPRSATAIAVNDVDVLEIPFEAMEKIYENIPAYMKTIMASLAERLRKANDQLRVFQKERQS